MSEFADRTRGMGCFADGKADMSESADRTKGVSEFTGAHNAWNPVAEQPAEPPVAADAAAVPANEADVNDGEDMRESSGSDDDSNHRCNACHQRHDHLGVCSGWLALTQTSCTITWSRVGTRVWR